MEKQIKIVFFFLLLFIFSFIRVVIATGKIAMARYEIDEYFEMIGFFFF